ncbi:MAG: XrtA system polysaccharide chain length determinant [Acidobacteriota bacterium]
MEELYTQIRGTMIAMWQRRWLGVAAAAIISVLSAIGVVVMHDRFEASARIYVDTATVLKPLMTGLAFQPDVDQQVRMLAKTLISRPNVETIMGSPKVGWGNLKGREREKVIDRLTKDIKVIPSGNTNLYEISFRDPSPERAVGTVEELVALFVRSGVGDKQRDSEEARVFLDEQIRNYEAKLSASENRLKDFKLKNFGLTGTASQDYFARMSSLSDEASKLRVDLRAAEQARDALKRELSAEDPSMPAEALPGNPVSATSEIDTRLDAQKRQLDELMRRYTDEHPDVVATKRNIAQLEAQKRQELDSRARSGKSRNAPTSPVFQRIRIALAEAEAKVASLRGQLAEQQSQLAAARSMAGRQPEVEAELAQLNRDYEVVRKNYEQLVTRREQASLGEKIDETTKVADFRVVEPPRVTPQPVKPNRMMVAVLALVAAIAAGLGATFGLSQVFQTVNDTRQLKTISGRPVLGSVSMVVSPEQAEKTRRNNQLFGLAVGALLVFHVAMVVLVKLHALP